MLLFTLLLGAALGHLYFILLKTDFIVEYAKLLHISKLIDLDNYIKWQENNNYHGNGWPLFIRERYNNFPAKLIGCPFCFITFSALIISIMWGWWFLLIGLSSAAIGSIVFMIELWLYENIYK